MTDSMWPEIDELETRLQSLVTTPVQVPVVPAASSTPTLAAADVAKLVDALKVYEQRGGKVPWR